MVVKVKGLLTIWCRVMTCLLEWHWFSHHTVLRFPQLALVGVRNSGLLYDCCMVHSLSGTQDLCDVTGALLYVFNSCLCQIS
jgi:hypothetical protein